MSKILLLSAGTRPESKNNKAAGIVAKEIMNKANVGQGGKKKSKGKK